jgi:hypothetical protein
VVANLGANLFDERQATGKIRLDLVAVIPVEG